jgi:hypothetical protein
MNLRIFFVGGIIETRIRNFISAPWLRFYYIVLFLLVYLESSFDEIPLGLLESNIKLFLDLT